MKILKKVLANIRACEQKGKTKLIAIDGLGGSGKSSFAKSLLTLDPELNILELDHFPCLPKENPYHPLGAQTRVNLERFQREALLPLVNGQPAVYKNSFWWPTHEKPKTYTVPANGTVLVEGCYSFHLELRAFYDYSIWIECPAEEALKRAITRDGEDGANIWQQVHAPNERNYARVQKPMDSVDLVILKDSF
jgi:uridine kinase